MSRPASSAARTSRRSRVTRECPLPRRWSAVPDSRSAPWVVRWPLARMEPAAEVDRLGQGRTGACGRREGCGHQVLRWELRSASGHAEVRRLAQPQAAVARNSTTPTRASREVPRRSRPRSRARARGRAAGARNRARGPSDGGWDGSATAGCQAATPAAARARVSSTRQRPVRCSRSRVRRFAPRRTTAAAARPAGPVGGQEAGDGGAGQVLHAAAGRRRARRAPASSASCSSHRTSARPSASRSSLSRMMISSRARVAGRAACGGADGGRHAASASPRLGLGTVRPRASSAGDCDPLWHCFAIR